MFQKLGLRQLKYVWQQKKARIYQEAEEDEDPSEEPSEQQGSEEERPAADDHSSVLFFKHPTSVRMRNREAQVQLSS